MARLCSSLPRKPMTLRLFMHQGLPAGTEVVFKVMDISSFFDEELTIDGKTSDGRLATVIITGLDLDDRSFVEILQAGPEK